MVFSNNIKKFLKPFVLLAVFTAVPFGTVPARAESPAEKTSNLGVIKGVVRDERGSPIAEATVAIFRVGTSKLLKQVRSAADGSFFAKILPGTYTVLAVAQGFNAATVAEVSVNRSDELVYGFKLERSGSGNTLPEKRADRQSSKWNIRAAQIQRSIYQNTEGNAPVEEVAINDDDDAVMPDEPSRLGRPQTVVETYYGSSFAGDHNGINVATLIPLGENARIVLAGQTGIGAGAPKRFETSLKFRPVEDHDVRLNASFGQLGTIKTGFEEESLGQVSFQALDEWKVREGVVVVLGVDYSRFVGAGDDFSVSPRLGLQVDLNARTRFRSAYTTQTEEQSWSRAVELEDAQIMFRDAVAVEDFVIEETRPLMNKSRRLEFGIERVLDGQSSIEANAFLDTTLGRGVGLTNLPFDSLGGGEFTEFVANQQGRSNGIRVVYNRRLNGLFSTSAGYAFGTGQQLSGDMVTTPGKIFDSGFFQTFFGQFDADLTSGTTVRTIFRLSPQATVFAIDPFKGRLAIYDPGLSVLVTQSLPNLGLPFHAQAVVDARNLFDFQTGVTSEEGILRINSQRRALRGGILVRF